VAKRALIVASGFGAVRGRHNNAACIAQVLAPRGFEIAYCVDDRATRAGILECYLRLIAECQSDDAAVVYYTGHGGLVTNRDYATDTLVPHRFQYICPTDYAQTRDDDFRGVSALELSLLLAELTAKKRNVTTIFDCCYAALMTR
jgi:uncharacterized caspase-like protein